MMTDSPRHILNASLKDFLEGVNNSVHLNPKHCFQFLDEAEIHQHAAELKEIVWKDFLKRLANIKNPDIEGDRAGDSMNQLGPGMQQVIGEVLERHQGYKTEAETFFQERIDGFCQNLKMSVDVKLQIQDMDLETLKKVLEDGKLRMLSAFEVWNIGNAVFFGEQKEKLRQRMEELDKTFCVDKIAGMLEASVVDGATLSKETATPDSKNVTSPSSDGIGISSSSAQLGDLARNQGEHVSSEISAVSDNEEIASQLIIGSGSVSKGGDSSVSVKDDPDILIQDGMKISMTVTPGIYEVGKVECDPMRNANTIPVLQPKVVLVDCLEMETCSRATQDATMNDTGGERNTEEESESMDSSENSSSHFDLQGNQGYKEANVAGVSTDDNDGRRDVDRHPNLRNRSLKTTENVLKAKRMGKSKSTKNPVETRKSKMTRRRGNTWTRKKASLLAKSSAAGPKAVKGGFKCPDSNCGKMFSQRFNCDRHYLSLHPQKGLSGSSDFVQG